MYDQLYEEPTTTTTTDVAVAAPAAVAPRGIHALKAAVIDEFAQTEPVLRTLVARYDNVAIDCTTPKGMKAAKEARHDMREHGRYVVQRATDDLKGEVNALKPLIDAESERLVAIVKPTEDRYDEAIKAQEAIDKAAKAEREAKEAERVAAYRANIAKLAGYVGQAQGRTSDQIATIINGVSAIEIDPAAWEEFAVGAEMQKAETLEALRALFASAKHAEEAAAAAEAKRIEQERIAAELAEKARILAEKQAEIDRKLAELAAAEKAEADRVAAAGQAKRDAETKARIDAQAKANEPAAAEFFARTGIKAAEPVHIVVHVPLDEANALAQEAAAEALQVATDSTPADVAADSYGLAAIEQDVADAAPADEPMHTGAAVSPGVLHPAPEAGPVEFAGEEPECGLDNARGLADVIALLSHLDEAFTGKFAAHPKPSAAWWGRLRQLADETRSSVLA